MSPMMHSLRLATFFSLLCCTSAYARSIERNTITGVKEDASVLILGGGVAGVIAARELHDKGITNFKIVEARGELGGRMMSHKFGAPGRQITIEVSAFAYQSRVKLKIVCRRVAIGCKAHRRATVR